MLRTETLICIYTGVFLCMLAFHCLLILGRWGQEKRLDHCTRFFSDLLKKELEAADKGETPDPSLRKQLRRKLRSPGCLASFYAAASMLEEEQKLNYLKARLSLFDALAEDYGKKACEQQAYFAYIMCRLQICEGLEKGPIIDMMMRLVAGRSSCCRENALKALYSFGSAANVFKALRLIDENEIFHHDKLLTDGLSAFQGDQNELLSLLWNHFKEFHEPLQVAVLNHIRLSADGWQERIYELLQDTCADMEVKIAAVRYFGRHSYEPARELLYRLLLEENDRQWELRAVCASVLRNYPGLETAQVLTRTLGDANWYIRWNSGESLNALSDSACCPASLYQGTDPYAKQMIDYQSERRTLKERAKSEKKGAAG